MRKSRISGKIFLLSFLFFLSVYGLSAQTIGFVDTEYVLNNLPSYKKSKEKLDAKLKEWGTEIKQLEDSLEIVRLSLESEKIILTENQFEKRKSNLDTLEKEILDLKDQRFGIEGDVVELRANLIKPIQNKIYNAVAFIAKKERIKFVIDKSDGVVMIYSDPSNKYDITNKVLNRLK